MWFWITKPYSIIHPCSRYLWFLIRIWIYIYITYIIFTYLYTRTKQMHMFEFRVFNIRGEVSRWSWTCIPHSLKIGMLSWGNRIFQFKHEGSSKSCWTNWVCSHSIPNAAGFSGCLYLVHWTEILIIEEIDPRERKHQWRNPHQQVACSSEAFAYTTWFFCQNPQSAPSQCW